MKSSYLCPMKHNLTYRPKSPGTNIGGYRYFFNGQEGDNEVFGETANFGYEFRQYDSRLGRWWSVDAKWNEYPSISPFAFCYDSPIMLVDPDGEKVVPFGLLEYYGKAQYGNSHLGEVQKIGIYNVIPIYDNNNKIISYNAVREYSVHGETHWRTEYQMNPSDLGDFKDNIDYYESCANMIYAFGEPDWSSIAMTNNIISGDFRGFFNELGKQWENAIYNSDFWIGVAFSVAGSNSNNAKINQLAKDLRKWVGNDARGFVNKSNDLIILSKDQTRRIRFDLNNYQPHQHPHAHVEEYTNGNWEKSGPLYPKDVNQ